MEAGVTAAAAERIRRARRSTDRWLLVLSLGVVLASVVLTPSTEAVSLFGWTVPPLCVFSALFDLECFGCGLTRSFTYMGHGDVRGALELHLLGPILYILVVAQVPLRSWRLWRDRSVGVPPARG